MRRLLAFAVVAVPTVAVAQTSSSKSSSQTSAPSVTSAPAEAVKPGEREQIRKEVSDELRKEMEQRLEKAKEEMRDEMRAQMATQQASKAWDTEWQEEKRKLELVEINGYLRMRPNLLVGYDLGRGTDPWGYNIFPRPFQVSRKTLAGADMRFRFEPTINVSEDIRIRAQIDLLNNLVLGTTPVGAHLGAPDQAYPISFLSNTQVSPVQGQNSYTNAVAVNRLYGEVNTQLGLLRFGRMGSHWGMGVLTNDGDCFDCDYGDTVDRVMFVLKAFGWFLVPMFDFVSTGPTTNYNLQQPFGEVYAQDNGSNTISFDLAIARRDTDKEIQKKIDGGDYVLNGGIYGTFRTQTFDTPAYNICSANGSANLNPAGFNSSNPYCSTNAFGQLQTNPQVPSQDWILRNAWAVTGDLWGKLQMKDLRIEAEVAVIGGRLGSYDPLGTLNPTQQQSIPMFQWGGALQGEYKLLDGQLSIQVEVGAASGSRSWGMGSLPGRTPAPGSGLASNAPPAPGIVNGPSFYCTAVACPEGTFNNFLFNRDYRIDTILWRDLYQGVTNAMYAKPTLRYEITEGLSVFASAIYSRAFFIEGTPSASCGGMNNIGYDPNTMQCTAGQKLLGDANLGIELNAGANYISDDGFILGLTYAVLFPLSGLNNNNTPTPINASTAQAVRGTVGVKF